MALTYKVRGSDGKEYGPVTLEELKAWLRENRFNGQTELMRSDMDYWAPAAKFTELQEALAAAGPAPAPITPPPTAPSNDATAEATLNSSASWFYCVAGLSLVNVICAFVGKGVTFYFGLGMPEAIIGFSDGVGAGGRMVALLVSLLIVGCFALFGVFAYKRHTWAFIVGLILYIIDAGLLYLGGGGLLRLVCAGIVVFCLVRGLKACWNLNAT